MNPSAMPKTRHWLAHEPVLSSFSPEWAPADLPGIQIGNLTAWKTSAFTCEAAKIVPLAPKVAEVCGDAATVEALTDRHCQILMATTLRHLATGSRLVLGNTHLTAPRSDLDHERKLVQTQQMAAGLAAFAHEVKQQSKNQPRPRVILAGDFNATPDSELYELVCAGKVDPKRMASLKQRGLKGMHGAVKRLPFEAPTTAGLHLQSAHATCGEGEPVFTNYTQNFKGCLDYVTYEPRGLKCTQVAGLPGEDALKKDTALPNAEHPSDHLPVSVRMEFE